MAFMRRGSDAHSRITRRFTEHKGKRRQSSGNRTLRLEPLEDRQLLSLTVPAGYAIPDYKVLLSSNGVTALATAAPTGYTPAQLRLAYGFDKISFNGVTGDGAGTTIAIVDAYDDPNIAADLHKFDVQFGLADPVFTKVNQYGSASPPTADAGWSVEIALDVEWAHAMAPKANILLVEAASSSMNDLMTAVDYARHATGVVAVSMSWGGSEFNGEKSYDSYFTTPAGHGGVTFVASSGDSGAPVSYPAVSPNVLSVGGTTLYVNSQGYASEYGWSGSGGGVSSYEAKPSYQNGVVTQSSIYRTNPDVAYDADPNTGFSVYCSYGNSSSTPWMQVGGTSAGAPQWAALVAIADQGRILAGKTSLDGATQTMAMLYSMSASNFHDTTGGTSSGSPRYSASGGYDLVTGRGSPYANLVVASLAGSSTTTTSTATHFSISAPTTDTAGTPISITVTALDASNNVVSGFVGTIHFTSSDGAAVLPANYTFLAADKGVHVFTGVNLFTAGSETITAADTATGSILGAISVLVNPAAAYRLAFTQQPSSAAPGGIIAPAVTVRVLDAYGNLVTNDNTDQVILSLGANPTGAALSGTTTATAVRGVATFSNLSINLAGTGYTLVAASSGRVGVTSASFNVSANTLVEGFEGSSGYYVVGASYPSASISTAAAHDGVYGLLDSNGNDWIYRNDAAAQVKQGDTISVWLKFSGSADGRAYFGFGASAVGTLSLVASPNTNQLLLQSNLGYGYTNLAAVSSTWAANHWYRLEVSWGTSGTIIGKVYDSNGTTLLATVTGSTTAITSGGIAFRAIGSNKYWDTVQVTPGASQFSRSALAAAGLSNSALGLTDAVFSVPQGEFTHQPNFLVAEPASARATAFADDLKPLSAAARAAALSGNVEAANAKSPLDRRLVDLYFEVAGESMLADQLPASLAEEIAGASHLDALAAGPSIAARGPRG